MAEKTEKKASIDTKALLKELGTNNTKMRYKDRKTVKITEATKHYRKGQIVSPHVTFADALIKEGIAKEVKE